MEEERTTNKVAIPVDVKESMKLTGNNFDAADVKVTCEDDGDKGFGTFYLLYCDKCQKDNLLSKFSKYLPADPTITDLHDRWDEIMAEEPSLGKYADTCGCFVPNEKEVHAGPNA